jgi:hypothetical protein
MTNKINETETNQQITLTLQQLKNAQSCFTAIKIFQTLFSEEADLTLENLKLFEEKYKEKHHDYLPYALMCFLLKSLSKTIYHNYCNDKIFNNKSFNNCEDCPLDNENNTTEDRFNNLLQILKEYEENED